MQGNRYSAGGQRVEEWVLLIRLTWVGRGQGSSWVHPELYQLVVVLLLPPSQSQIPTPSCPVVHVVKKGREDENEQNLLHRTHIEEAISLVVHLVGWPPPLHPLPLKEVDVSIGLGRQYVKSALVCFIGRIRHGTQVKVNSPWRRKG